jgi:hypothetical protein
MQGKFYNNKSDARYLNKSIELKHDNIPLEILTPASVVRPVLKVSSGLIGQSVNYVYVPDLERYYFIRNWTMENGYVTIECEVDVLMSFKEAIKQQNVILSRQEKNYNLYQVDNKMKLLNAPATRVIEFPSGFDYSTQEFVLILTGSAS